MAFPQSELKPRERNWNEENPDETADPCSLVRSYRGDGLRTGTGDDDGIEYETQCKLIGDSRSLQEKVPLSLDQEGRREKNEALPRLRANSRLRFRLRESVAETSPCISHFSRERRVGLRLPAQPQISH